MKSKFKHAKILITGASGFIGKYLAQRLADCGAKLYLTDIHDNHVRLPNAEYIPCDLSDTSVVKRRLASLHPDYLFHLAAFKDRSSALNDFLPAVKANLFGTLNLFTFCNIKGTLRSAVLLGTGEEYGLQKSPVLETAKELPLNAYSFSKFCGSALAQSFSAIGYIPAVVLRTTLAYGPGQGSEMFLPALIRALLRGETFKMTKGGQARNYIYVSDLIDVLLASALKKEAVGGLFNVAGPDTITIRDIALKVQQKLGKSGLIDFNALTYRPSEIMDYRLNDKKLRKLLDWKPKIRLTRGLDETIAYYRSSAH